MDRIMEKVEEVFQIVFEDETLKISEETGAGDILRIHPHLTL